MRAGFGLVVLLATISTAPASDLGPVIVIPGRPGVPIIINGVDASYSVVEGDWGLAKGIHVQPVVYGGRVIDLEPHVGHYFPSSGKLPGYGRLEIEPPGPPKPAQSFHQSWSARSTPQAEPEVPLYPPPVILAPPNSQLGLPPDPRDRRPGNPRP